jgi:glutathione peroxidase
MKKRLVMMLVMGLLAAQVAQAAPQSPADSLQKGQAMDYRTIPFQTIEGAPSSLQAFAGKVILVVNVASKCGFTPQYAGLEALYRRYADQGLTIIGFPANNFLRQEPGTDAEILSFCQSKYDVTFPMMSKISVAGKDQHPLYAYLTKESPVPGKITWNFNKFLLDRQGNVIARFDSKVKPDDPALIAQIEALLAQPK